MPYRFLFVMDPLAGILPDKDTTFVLMLESQRRGHSVYCCEVLDLFAQNATAYTRRRHVRVARRPPHFEVLEDRAEPLESFQAIFMRKDPPVDQAYLYATLLLDLVRPNATFVMNRPQGLRDANEKLYALNFPAVTPTTMITNDIPRLREFLDVLGGQMIIKPLDGCGGAGVFFADRSDRNLNSLLETATVNGTRLIVAQEYLDAVREGDKRVIVLNGESIGAVLRVPSDHDHRGNIHVGGTCRQAQLTAKEMALVEAVGRRLRTDGLYLVGLDLIGERLTEVNVTSPTGVQQINSLDSTNLETKILDFVESKILLAPS